MIRNIIKNLILALKLQKPYNLSMKAANYVNARC